MEDRDKWLSELKEGDKVALVAYKRCPRIAAVTHTTKTQVHVGSEKYRRVDGREMASGGAGWDRWELQPVTHEHKTQIEYASLRHWLRGVADSFNRTDGHPTLQQLRAMREAFDNEEEA